jgi:hypothetical protein
MGDMCNHISVVLPNRPGELGRVAAILAAADVNILGHQSVSQGNSSIVHLLCDSHDRAFERLRKEYRFYCNQKKVLIVAASNAPGQLSNVLQHLASNSVNLESSYQAVLGDQFLFVFELKDREATEIAERILLESHLHVYKQQPLAA